MNLNLVVKSLAILFLLSFTQSGKVNGKNYYSNILLNNNDYRERVYSLPLQIELQYNEDVEEKIQFFIEKNKKLSASLLGRAELYFPAIDSVLRNNGLPEEMKYLPVLETSLIPYAQSGAGAAGLWQFMESTATNYGLKITNAVDERRDPVKSTAAIAKYLKRLFTIYNDWTLVLAAYNCGDGTLNKALKKSDSRSYWDARKYLPQQTQEFVPKFIAIAYLMNYYYLHDIEPVHPTDDYVFTATLKVFEKIDLDKLSDKYQIDKEVIRRLNPAYTKNFIPASEEGIYTLTLPELKMYEFTNDNNNYHDILYFSDAAMARKQQAIAAAEPNAIIRESLPLTLPLSSSPTTPILADNSSSALRIDDKPVTIKVVRLKKGQSINDIAKEYNQDFASLMQLNSFDTDNPPRLGDQIKLKI